ncbi:hypothetical protein [Paraburkholderia adhaesiva]|uniref:hypothetical protein n=1 Tax=Paraburkholderia adhaesiva TaxID=2883244 RepID=UPI001F1672CE|nr:hypothetical protein [Paraburkholderia adhaesiva]
MYQHKWFAIGATLVLTSGCVTINPASTPPAASTPVVLYVFNVPPSATTDESRALQPQRAGKAHGATPRRALPIAQTSSRTGTTVSSPVDCAGFVMPDFPEVPRAPLKELDAVPRGDTAAALVIAEKHIIDLHHYILRARRTLDTAYQDYRSRCHQTAPFTPPP